MPALNDEVRAQSFAVVNDRDQSLFALLTAPAAGEPVATVVMPPGYERRIHHYSVFARYLVRHGYSVLRFDFSNHVGLSDGEVFDFTMSSMAHDIEAVVRHVTDRDNAPPVALMASSLASRAALRAASRLDDLDRRLSGLVLILPVIDVEYTTTQAIGHNVVDEWRRGDVTDPRQPCQVLNHVVGYEFSRDALAGSWDGVETTHGELAELAVPVVAIAAERDDWVRPEDIEQAMSVPAPAPRSTVFLEATSHDLSHNAPVVRLLMEQVLEALAGLRDAPPPEVAHLDFDEIVETVTVEKAWKHDGYRTVVRNEVMI